VKENKTRTKKGLCRSETVILPLSYGLFEEEQEEKKNGGVYQKLIKHIFL
jgi:hypothetical protein